MLFTFDQVWKRETSNIFWLIGLRSQWTYLITNDKLLAICLWIHFRWSTWRHHTHPNPTSSPTHPHTYCPCLTPATPIPYNPYPPLWPPTHSTPTTQPTPYNSHKLLILGSIFIFQQGSQILKFPMWKCTWTFGKCSRLEGNAHSLPSPGLVGSPTAVCTVTMTSFQFMRSWRLFCLFQ